MITLSDANDIMILGNKFMMNGIQELRACIDGVDLPTSLCILVVIFHAYTNFLFFCSTIVK